MMPTSWPSSRRLCSSAQREREPWLLSDCYLTADYRDEPPPRIGVPSSPLFVPLTCIVRKLLDNLKYMYVCDWADSEKGHRGLLGQIARTAPTDAHDAQLSNGPTGASIRVREVRIQQCQRLTSHSTQLWS